ncbi:peptide chain release factor N(5)-glutamine methyltransferase [Candidatus Pelagibacter sp.]|nr:peptide chain release factor N(5)-glutamine methyltransferase [Candidatus Pelagibacter sp.]
MRLEIAINKAFEKLNKHNIKSALLDSELLMSKALKEDREFIILNLDKKIREKDYLYFQKLINERSKGKPIAYLTGKKYFWKYEFDINENVLIPRPDTEIIIEQVLDIYKNKNKINFLEVGTGSGCILLSILKERKDFKATGIDISGHALKVCNINAYKLGVKNRVKLFKSDIDKFLNGKYDLIISNPPYIKKLDLKYLEKDVIKFEPKLALDGGLDGISEIRKIIKKSSELIKKGGKLILEIAFNQKKEVKQLLRNNSFYINSVIKDLAKNDRCIISTKIEK